MSKRYPRIYSGFCTEEVFLLRAKPRSGFCKDNISSCKYVEIFGENVFLRPPLFRYQEIRAKFFYFKSCSFTWRNPNLIKYSVCFYLAFLFCFNCACVIMCVLFITYNLDLDNNILHLMP